MKKHLTFVEKYDALLAPEPMEVTADTFPEFEAIKQDYFLRLQNSLELSRFVLLDSMVQSTDRDVSRRRIGEYTQIDDLWFQDAQLLGAAIRKARPREPHTIRFTKYPLTSETEGIIKTFHAQDRLI